MKNIIGRKLGMTNVFTEDGRYVPVTVIAAGPCSVIERKTREKDGYEAVVLGFEDAKHKQLTKPHARTFREAQHGAQGGAARVPRGLGDDKAGDTVTVGGFVTGDKVDVIGTSKGQGSPESSSAGTGRAAAQATAR